MAGFDVETNIDWLLNNKFSKRIRENAIHDTQLLRYNIKKWVPSNEDEKIQIEHGKEVFRINFRLPVYLLNDKSFNGIRRACFHGYHKHNDKTVSMSSLTPVYNLNLNHITALRAYGHAAIESSSDNITEEVSDFACKKYVLPETRSPRKMQMSSMNFLLPGNTKGEHIDGYPSKIVRLCYRYLCWNPPLEHFDLSTIHSIFIHSAKRIFGIAKIYKTIAKIKTINKNYREEFTFANRRYSVANAKAYMIFQDKKKIFTNLGFVYVAEPYATELEEGDLVNCLVVSPVVQGGYMKHKTLPPTIMGVVSHSDRSTTITQSASPIMRYLVNMFVWKKNQRFGKNTLLTRVSGSDELFDDIWGFLQENRRMFYLDNRRDAKDAFEDYINLRLFYIPDSQGSIWQVPPSLLAYMLDREIPIMGVNELSLFNIILPSKTTPCSRCGSQIEANEMHCTNCGAKKPYIDWKWKLNMSKEFQRIQKGPMKQHSRDFLNHFPRIANRTIYSRLISKSSTDASLR